MAYMQGYNAYRDTGVKTASQGKLVVMLYEEAVRQMDEAISRIGNDGKIEVPFIERFNANIQKTQQIINELQVTLDMDRGGDIAKNLMALYVFFNQQLLEVSIKHDKKILASVRKMMSELCESWRAAANSTANGPAYNKQTRQAAVNITG
ncbi:MAG: flagellar export chaperone FliS [Treponema sp.]|nr:flagellar export chaperone FliS [Treponema sp.]